MDTNFNSVLDLSRLDYIFLNEDDNDKKNNTILDLTKLIYGEEQILEKYLKKQIERLPIERYDYLFQNLDDNVSYILTISPEMK
jgi:hypothetical protein